MAQTANTQEPTMEEILASIRRIISEDGEEQKPAAAAPAEPGAKPAAAAARPASKPAPEPEIESEDEDVLELTDIVPEEEPLPPPAPRARPVSADDVVMVERPAERAPPRARLSDEQQSLISDQVRDQAVNSFMQLTRDVLVSETADPRSLEALVQAMLRPMLQQWLNENLPTMVETLVRQEIEHVTRRGRL